MGKPRKPITEAQRAQKNLRAKERYQELRKTGFTPSQARSLKKTVETNPKLLNRPSKKVASALSKYVKGFKPKDVKPRTQTANPPPPGVKRRFGGTNLKAVARQEEFARFVRNNPGLGGKQAIREFRKAGGSISHERGLEVYRTVLGKEKNLGKVTRIKFYSLKDYPLYGKEFFKNYSKKDRYLYLVQFQVEREGFADTTEEHMILYDPHKLTYEEVIVSVYQYWNKQHDSGNLKEIYKAIRIVPGSVVLIRAIDTTL